MSIHKDPEQAEVVLWLESFDNVEQLRKEWADAPRFQKGHALVELLENVPSCALRADAWTKGTANFPLRSMLAHDHCVDPEVDDALLPGITYDRTFTELIYSEGSTHGIH